MQRNHARAVVTVTSALMAATAPRLLAKVRAGFDATGRLRTTTRARMYAAYTVHAAATAVAARHRLGPLRVRSRAVDAVAAVAGAAGITLMAAGMRRFGGARHASGMSHPQLATGGVYTLTRNPEYVRGIARPLVAATLASRIRIE